MVLDHGRHWEVVEDIGEVLPDVGVPILPHALVIESVDLSDLDSFMVASQKADPSWEPDLQSE